MNDNRSNFKKHAMIGPGGWKCACCAPAPGKEKKRYKRLLKRRDKNQAMREARNEI